MAIEDGGGATGPGVQEIGTGRGGGDPAGDARVPVGVATRTASRLDEAESALEAMRERVSELEAQLAEKDAALDALEQRHRIESAVSRAGAIDIEAAALLTAVAVEGLSDPDIESAVKELRSTRPYLFEGGAVAAAGGASMSPGVSSGGAMDAAAEAASSGDRGALMRYLRMRRGAL